MERLLRTGRPRNCSSIPGRGKFYIFSKGSGLALRSFQRPLHCVPTENGEAVQRNSFPHLVPKIRKRGALLLLSACVRGVHRDNAIFTFTFIHTSYHLRLSQRFSFEPKVIPTYGDMTYVARR